MRISVFHLMVGVGLILGVNFSSSSAQQTSNTDNIKVYFFKTENNNNPKDSTVIYANQNKNIQNQAQTTQTKTNNALLGIHGDVIMNGILNFVGIPNDPNKKAQEYRCVKAMNDGEYWGNMFFYGEKWENGILGDMSGNGMVSFNGSKKQSIENTANNHNRAKFPGIQINNQHDVYLQGSKAIRIDKYALFYLGKLKHSNDTIFFSKTIDSALCDDKDSYIEFSDFNSGQALVAKDTAYNKNQNNKKFYFRFPFGSKEAYAPLSVILTNKQTQTTTQSGTNNKNYSVFARFDNDMTGIDNPKSPAIKRYDKGARSFWSVKTNIPLNDPNNGTQNSSTKYLIPDSIYTGLEKGYSKKLSVNFRPDRAFITQFVDRKTRELIPKPIMGTHSNWDIPKLTEEQLRPDLVKISKAGKQTILIQYKREGQKTNLRLHTDKSPEPEYSYYTIANYDKNPLTSLFEKTKIAYDNDMCAIKTEWTFSDHFSGQRYYIEITTDTTVIDDKPRDGLIRYKAKVNDNLATITNNGSTYRYNLFNTQLPPGIFKPEMVLYARILEEDLGGLSISSSSKPFHLTCITNDSDQEVPLVYASGVPGGGSQMIVQYKAKYPEELSFTIYNILGQKELYLGTREINPGLNNINFNLPVSITHGHRYLLLITGGAFNEKVKTYSLTFSIK